MAPAIKTAPATRTPAIPLVEKRTQSQGRTVLPSKGVSRVAATQSPPQAVPIDRSKNLIPFQESALPHQHSVFAFALSLAGDRAVADDLVQDTYLRAWRSFGTFTVGSDCRAWLFKICKNRFFDLCRRRRRRPRPEDLDAIQPTTEDLDYELRTDLARRLRGEAHDPELLPEELVVALGELPDDFRVPILLCDLDEMPYREIASHLQIPLGTVRSRIARGRALLRRRLSAYAQDLGYSLEDGGAAA